MYVVSQLVVGGLAGWLASRLLRDEAAMAPGLNIAIGTAGGILGGWALPQLGLTFGVGWLGYVATAFIGAAGLLFVINLIDANVVDF